MSERDEFEAWFQCECIAGRLYGSDEDAAYAGWQAARWRAIPEATARAKPQQAVPEGWKLVPEKPSVAMCIRGSAGADHEISGHTAAQVYAFMLAAAPQPSQEPEKAQECSICAVDPMLCSRHKMSSEEFARRMEFRQKYQD